MTQPVLQRQLFGPGPSNPYPEATAALGLPLLGHLDPAFIARMDRVCDSLRTLWGTSNARTLPLSATGSAGMEAAFPLSDDRRWSEDRMIVDAANDQPHDTAFIEKLLTELAAA